MIARTCGIVNMILVACVLLLSWQLDESMKRTDRAIRLAQHWQAIAEAGWAIQPHAEPKP